ncbi:MAG: hypothetical protein RIM99_16045 [Cyclobacteriaceae bacterium]
MKKNILIVFLFAYCIACNSDEQEKVESQQVDQEIEIAFDKAKWKTKEGKSYPFREKMLNGVVYNDTIRTLNKTQLIELPGEPDYIRE